MESSVRDVGLLPHLIAEVFPPKHPPWCRPPIKFCNIKCNKNDASTGELRSEFYKHLDLHRNSTKIFTDGSKSSDGVGLSVVLGSQVIKKKIPSLCSIFIAELYAIFTAVQYIFNHSCAGDNFTIFTDSMSALCSLKKLYPVNILVQEVQDWLVLLSSRRKIQISFCWVPAHIGISGNELADSAAKEAARLSQVSSIGIPHNLLKAPIHHYIINKWQDYWSSLSNNLKLKSVRPSVYLWTSPLVDRRSSIILTRLRVGHSYLTHRYLMAGGAERQAPICSSCHEVISIKHILIDCPLFNNARRSNLLLGRSFMDILGEDAPIGRICKFLKEINLFYDI